MLEVGCRFHKVLASILLLMAGAPDFGRQADPDELKLGFISDLTNGTYGMTAKYALEDRVQAINAQGGINGLKVHLTPYDHKGDPRQVVNGVRHLIDQDHVAAIIGPEIVFRTFASELGTIAEAAKVPIIATTASSPQATMKAGGSAEPFVFRAGYIDPYQAAILADFAFKDLAKRKAAVIYELSDPYSGSIMVNFKAEFTRLGGQVVAVEGFNWGNKDFKPYLAKVAQTKPDCLVIASDWNNEPGDNAQEILGIIQQAKAVGLQIQYLGTDTWMDDKVLAAAGTSLDGCCLTTGLSAEDPKFADFNARFQQTHNLKCKADAYYALDALAAMEYAVRASLEKTHKIDPEVMKEALETMKDVPVFTGRLTMESTTHNPHNPPMLIVTVKDSKWQTVKTYQPE